MSDRNQWKRGQQLPPARKESTFQSKQNQNQNRSQNDPRNQPARQQQQQQKQLPQQNPTKPIQISHPPQNAWTKAPAWVEKPKEPAQPAVNAKAPASTSTPVSASASATNRSVEPTPAAPVAASKPTGGGAWKTATNSKKGGSNTTTATSLKTPAIVTPENQGSITTTNNKPTNAWNKNTKAASKKEQMNNNAVNQRQIHGKKPKLSNIKMGDLVPRINKILPKNKTKEGATTSINSSQDSTNNNGGQKRKSTQPFDVAQSADFPALAGGSNWPSLAATKAPTNEAPVRTSTAVTKNASTDLKNQNTAHTGGSNNNNNNRNNHQNNANQPKKRKNATHQSAEAKTGKAKRKDGNLSRGVPGNSDSTTRVVDHNHLQGQFLVPPGRILDSSRAHASFQADGKGHPGEADLMMMMKQGQIVKGRQRLKPRKKRFTALKRKILLERLKVWQELQPDASESNKQSNSREGSTDAESQTICVYGFAALEELEDDDEYDEVLSNFTDMSADIGKVNHIYIPRESVEEDNNDAETEHPVFVQFETPALAKAARECWNGLVIGGQALRVVLVGITNTSDESTEEDWQKGCLLAVRNGVGEENSKADPVTCQIVLKDVLTESYLETKDSLELALHDLKSSAEQFGKVIDITVDQECDVFITYEGGQDVANSACEGLQNLYIHASASAVEITPATLDSPASDQAEILLENILTEDDLEDEDCLEESMNDIRSLLEKFGIVSKLDATGSGVIATFGEMTASQLQQTASELNGLELGGQIVTATILQRKENMESSSSCVVLKNLLTQDDFDDDDCLQESLDDVRELACQYGTVESAEADKMESAASSTVKLTYATPTEAEAAAKAFDGMVIGGSIVTASVETNSNTSLPSVHTGSAAGSKDVTMNEKVEDTKPMFSGDKRIPERFAACKRVPKVPNPGTPRNYAVLINDDSVKPLLVEMLNELMRLQVRGLSDKNAKARRRIVVGLREVARGLRANKAKMIVMANNLDEYGAIDGKLQEILDLAEEKGVPVLFELSKRVLGKAVGKKVKVSVVLVQGTDGAHQQFVKLKDMALRR